MCINIRKFVTTELHKHATGTVNWRKQTEWKDVNAIKCIQITKHIRGLILNACTSKYMETGEYIASTGACENVFTLRFNKYAL